MDEPKVDTKHGDERDLEEENRRLRREIARLHVECRDYRVALNRVAWPASWGVNPGYHREIARRVLIIGDRINELPPGADRNEKPA